MKIKIICGFKTKSPDLKQLESEYLKRLKNEYRIEITEYPYNKTTTANQHKANQAQDLVQKSSNKAWKILLAEDAKLVTSKGFSNIIEKRKAATISDLHFFIGGPYGIAKESYHHFDEHLAISLMTLPAELCRLLLVEQIYRAQCMNLGVPYHKE